MPGGDLLNTYVSPSFGVDTVFRVTYESDYGTCSVDSGLLGRAESTLFDLVVSMPLNVYLLWLPSVSEYIPLLYELIVSPRLRFFIMFPGNSVSERFDLIFCHYFSNCSSTSDTPRYIDG